ncbi:MAG: MBL fold metallo-hydrolase, partial [Chloroflexi bacterium]|nr:MBL fold metallo-hydrolase [Chloroflexota bacterium]
MFQAVAGAKGVDLANPDAIRAYLASLPFYVGGVIGGNTTCVEVRSGEHTIVVDAGSGLRSLGLSLMARDFALGKGTAHLFFTHAHWDHLMGFPFFKPAYIKGNRIICYAVNHHPLEYLGHLMTGPTFFPINPDVLPATFEYVTLQEGDTVQIGGVRVCNIHLHHPGIAYAYRFDDGDGSFVFASDAEFKTLDDENMRSHLEFFRGADVLAFDSQFTLKDAFTYEDWGHSSAFIGVDIALHSGTKRLITVHHDPNHTDRQIWEVAEAAQAYARLQPDGASLEVTAGYEGLEIFLGEWEALKVSETIEHGAIVLALSGRLTADAGQEIKARLQTLLAESWRRPVAVDLSDLAGAEPEGIAALSDAVTAAGDMPLTLVVPPHHGRRLIDLTVQNDRFAIYQDRQSALGAIVGPAHLRLAGRLISG